MKVANTFSLAGWLLADMVLAIMVVFMAVSALGVEQLPPAVGTTPEATPTPTPTPSPTPAPVSVHRNGYCKAFMVDAAGLIAGREPARQAARDRIQKEFEPLKGARAAIVITFGTGADVSAGQRLAVAVNDLILGKTGPAILPEVFTSAAEPRSYGYGHRGLVGKVWIEVFILTDKPALESACPANREPVT